MATILVLDDEPMIRSLIAGALRPEGHRLVLFSQLDPARSLRQSGSIQIDLYVLDINLRGETTTEWVEQLRDANERVITISGKNRVHGVVNLAKPFAISELRETVTTMLS